jgi:hypothetical protein
VLPRPVLGHAKLGSGLVDRHEPPWRGMNSHGSV